MTWLREGGELMHNEWPSPFSQRAKVGGDLLQGPLVPPDGVFGNSGAIPIEEIGGGTPHKPGKLRYETRSKMSFQDVISNEGIHRAEYRKQELGEKKAGISVDEVAGLLMGEVKRTRCRKARSPLVFTRKALRGHGERRLGGRSRSKLQGLEPLSYALPVPGLRRD